MMLFTILVSAFIVFCGLVCVAMAVDKGADRIIKAMNDIYELELTEIERRIK